MYRPVYTLILLEILWRNWFFTGLCRILGKLRPKISVSDGIEKKEISEELFLTSRGLQLIYGPQLWTCLGAVENHVLQPGFVIYLINTCEPVSASIGAGRGGAGRWGVKYTLSVFRGNWVFTIFNKCNIYNIINMWEKFLLGPLSPGIGYEQNIIMNS